MNLTLLLIIVVQDTFFFHSHSMFWYIAISWFQHPCENLNAKIALNMKSAYNVYGHTD